MRLTNQDLTNNSIDIWKSADPEKPKKSREYLNYFYHEND